MVSLVWLIEGSVLGLSKVQCDRNSRHLENGQMVTMFML